MDITSVLFYDSVDVLKLQKDRLSLGNIWIKLHPILLVSKNVLLTTANVIASKEE